MPRISQLTDRIGLWADSVKYILVVKLTIWGYFHLFATLALVPDHLHDLYLPLRLDLADLPGSQVLEKQVNAWKGEKAIMKAM